MAFMNLTALGVSFADLALSNLGSTSFELDHDWFTRQGLAIRTAAGCGGTLLVEGTDYTLATESSYLSSVVTQAVGAPRNVFHSITIISVQYQSVTLYFSGKYIADSNDAVDIPYTAIKNVSAAYTIRDTDKIGTLCTTTGASDVTHTLPTLVDNIGREIDFVKLDSGAGEVVIDGEGTESILWPGGSGLTCRVGLQNQHCKVKAFADGWRIMAGVVQPVAKEPDIGGGWHEVATLHTNWDLSAAGPNDWQTYTCTHLPTGSRKVGILYYIDAYSFFFRQYGSTANRLGYATYNLGSSVNSSTRGIINLPLSADLKFQLSREISGSGALYLSEQQYCLGPV